jgi:putative FmdB family regulatory protein
MPTYDYECNKCGHRFEAFQSISDKPINRCPKCKGPVKRLIGAGAGLIFKGSGFYITDYKNTKTGSDSGKPGKPKKEPAKKEKKPDKTDTGSTQKNKD